MGLSHKIFQRATIRGIADYLLYGNGPDEDSRTYEERLEDTYLDFEKAVVRYDEESSSGLLDLANVMTCEVASVYMEIGLQAGILLMKDLIKNLEIDECSNKTDYKKKYDLLFQKVMMASDILSASEDESAREARNILRSEK